MSLASQVNAFATRMATAVNSLSGRIGTLETEATGTYRLKVVDTVGDLTGQPAGPYLVRTPPGGTPAVSAPVSTIAAYVSGANVTTSGARSITTSVAVGDYHVVFIVSGGTGQTHGVSDSNGHTYTSWGTTSTATTALTVEVFATKVTSALDTSDTVTVTRSTSGHLHVLAAKASNVHGTSPTVGTAKTGTATTSVGSWSTSATDSIGVGGLALGVVGYTIGATSQTPSAGWTELGDTVGSGTGNPRGIAVIYKQVSTAGAQTPGGTFSSNSAGYAALGIALQDAA